MSSLRTSISRLALSSSIPTCLPGELKLNYTKLVGRVRLLQHIQHWGMNQTRCLQATDLINKPCTRFYSDATRRETDTLDMPVYQYVGKNRRRQSRIHVWGYTATGALGVKEFIIPKGKGKTRKRLYQSSPYTLQWDDKITSVACGYGFTLIASNSQHSTKVWGTGVNTDSQVGYHPRHRANVEGIQYIYTPAAIDLPLVRSRDTRVTQVACGRAHSLIVTDKEGGGIWILKQGICGCVQCFCGKYRQSPENTQTMSSLLQWYRDNPGDTNLFSIGNNSHGQCGRPVVDNEDYSKNSVVHKIKGVNGVIKQVVCGQDHSLFLTEEGFVYSCGWGADGQTGTGSYDSTSSPTQLAGDIQGETIVHIAAFADCCLAVSEKGELFGWGNSEYNQLAIVTSDTQVYEPRHLPFTEVGKIVSAAAGGSICAVLNDAGDVYVWGYGILGKGPKLADTMIPQCIPAILFGRSNMKQDIKVTRVYCGLNHFAAVTNKGDLFTWGGNGTGHLGSGSLQDQYFPIRVSIGAEVVDVACGVDHMVVLARTFI